LSGSAAETRCPFLDPIHIGENKSLNHHPTATTVSDTLPEALSEKLTALGAPEWFLRGLAIPVTSREVIATDGCPIHCEFWNEAEVDKPPLLLLHGYRANTKTWSAVAPYLTQKFRVVAMDWPGMGLSGRRTTYGNAPDFGALVPGVVEALGLGPATVIGHSFGGACAIHFAAAHAALVKRLVIIDTTILFPGHDEERRGSPRGRPDPYPDLESILARYRLLPEQPCSSWMLAYLAHYSVTSVEGGWSWRFDPRLGGAAILFDTQAALRTLKMPVDYVCGEHSKNGRPERFTRVADAIGQGRQAVVIPEAHHHIMLDQPLALSAALRALFA
jgi:pimeloyl-ACP methyl ester carboxylesterase